jgi:hypothetical protein
MESVRYATAFQNDTISNGTTIDRGPCVLIDAKEELLIHLDCNGILAIMIRKIGQSKSAT